MEVTMKTREERYLNKDAPASYRKEIVGRVDSSQAVSLITIHLDDAYIRLDVDSHTLVIGKASSHPFSVDTMMGTDLRSLADLLQNAATLFDDTYKDD